VVGRVPFWAALREVVSRGGDDDAAFVLDEQVRRESPGPDLHRLSDDLRASRLAGVIAAANPAFMPAELRELIAASCPAVAIMDDPPAERWPAVYFDYVDFLNRGIRIAKAAGRRNLSAVCPRFASAKLTAQFMASARAAGLTVKPWWVMAVSPAAADAVPACMRLLMNPEQRSRPDALIIADDTFVHPALTGLIEAGVCLPSDLLLVGMSNFPGTPDALPVERVFFDAQEVLGRCLELLRKSGRGARTARQTLVPARLLSELQTSPLSARESA
jgi:DNA-binding LacI/PurR family transcriptional regulator